MEYPTYSQIKQKVQERIDIEDETFISSDELLRHCQDAIDFCENKIHTFKVGDRYFETVAPITLVSGVRDYTLPSDIYGNKITKLLHDKNGSYYAVGRLTKSDRYEHFHDLERYSSSSDSYSYIFINASGSQKPVIRFVPRPQENTSTFTPTIDTTSGSKAITVSSATGLVAGQFISASGIPLNTMVESISGTTVTMSAPATATASTVASTFIEPRMLCYYLRNASKPTSDTDVIDIPEFSSYIVQYMICECLKKDSGNPRLEQEMMRLSELQVDMEGTLADMVPSQDDTMEADISIYGETV
jgi:hypothetical protein